jgi:hypothetical protein
MEENQDFLQKFLTVVVFVEEQEVICESLISVEFVLEKKQTCENYLELGNQVGKTIKD